MGPKALVAYVTTHGNGRARAGKAKAAGARAEPWRVILSDMIARGLTYGGIARELDGQGDRTPRGARWSDVAVGRMISRLGLVAA